LQVPREYQNTKTRHFMAGFLLRTGKMYYT
jgi:hypothetical protein